VAAYTDKTANRPVEAWLFDGSIASVHELMASHPDVWWERGAIRVGRRQGSSASLVPPGRWIVRDPKDNSLSAFEAGRFDERFEMWRADV